MVHLNQPIWEKIPDPYTQELVEQLIPSLTAEQLLLLLEDNSSTKLYWHVIAHKNANLEVVTTVLNKYPTLVDRAIENMSISDENIIYLYQNKYIPVPDLRYLFEANRQNAILKISDELVAENNFFVDYHLSSSFALDAEKRNIVTSRNKGIFG